MIQYKVLQFYADKENSYQNKLFTFRINNEREAFRVMLKFAINGNTFRFAAINIHIEVIGHKQNITDQNLKSFVDYFNNCEFERPPTLQEAINDYRMTYGE
jgi:hypothetical protein